MEVGDVTSRGRMRIFDDDEEEEGGRPREERREEGSRAVATNRWAGWLATRRARARPRPEEQPVMKNTASWGRW